MWTEWKLCSIVWFMVVLESLVGVDRKKVFIWRGLPDILGGKISPRWCFCCALCLLSDTANQRKQWLMLSCVSSLVLSCCCFKHESVSLLCGEVQHGSMNHDSCSHAALLPKRAKHSHA